MEIYAISDNSFHRRGAAWISGAYANEKILSKCPVCGNEVREPQETIELRAEPDTGTYWPDIIGCGGGIMGLFVSARVRHSFDVNELRYGKAFPCKVEASPKKLGGPPAYFYITGELGARVDFIASGYKIRSACPDCGNIVPDPASKPTQDIFKSNSWNGSDVFFTDLSRTAYFCSDRVLALAKESRWTNFRFVPLDKTHDCSYHGLDYAKK